MNCTKCDQPLSAIDKIAGVSMCRTCWALEKEAIKSAARYSKPSTITAAEVEAELNRPDRGKRSATQSIVLLIVSLVFFAASGLVQSSWSSLVLLIVILFIHESGHWLGMKFFGYRDLQMFFIPFFGAAVTGRETNTSATRRAIVSLLGPAPGILLGILSGLLYLKWREPIFYQFGITSIFLNGFNLLPIYPLDGGQFMETVIFSRHPVVEIIFKVLAAIALVKLAFMDSSILLGIVALTTLFSTREIYYQGKITQRLKDLLQGQEMPVTEKITLPQLELLVPELSQGLSSENINVKTFANRAESVWRRYSRQAPKLGPSLALLGVYSLFVILGVSGAIGLMMLRDAL